MDDRNSGVGSTGKLPEGSYDIVGSGRMGTALAASLRAAGVRVRGPLGRGANAQGASVVLLCVPDRDIAVASAALSPGALVGHVSASAELALLEPHERFTMHPLLSVANATAVFSGATCAVDGSTPRALAAAQSLATMLGMRPRIIPREQRRLYHAAASTASNFFTTVQGMAEELASRVGLDRDALVPLVQSTMNNWSALGARRALTGPIARGDEQTVQRQRAAVELGAPHLLPLWDALAAATRTLAQSSVSPASHPDSSHSGPATSVASNSTSPTSARSDSGAS